MQGLKHLLGSVTAWLVLLGCALTGSSNALSAQPRSVDRPPVGARYAGQAFTFTPVAAGVYHAVGTGALAVGSNAVVIVNPADVVVVDSHVSPAAAWALRRELRTLTDRPIRTVITTHFHYDHAHGNQLYGPDVEIIGHEVTREALLAGASQRGEAYEGLVRVLRQRLDSLRRVLDTARSPGVRTATRARLGQVRDYQAAVNAVKPTPPGITMTRELALIRGERLIRILFLGRGHTAGDVVVWLPGEQVLSTGDLVGSGLPFLGDGYPEEWVETLGRIQQLPWTVLLPGHGPPIRDRTVPEHLQQVLRAFVTQGRSLLARGMTPEDAAAALDLTAYATWYPALRDPRFPDTLERFTIGLHRLQRLDASVAASARSSR